MSVTDPLLNRKMAVEFVLDTGTDPTPSASITNGLEITQDSTIAMDQTEQNSQADVVSDSMTKRPTIIGKVGGSFTINGNMVSTDGTNPPPIGTALKMAGMSESEAQITIFADVAGLTNGLAVTGDVSGATGVIRVINGTQVVIELSTATEFEAEAINTGDFTISSVETEKAFVYAPDSDSTQTGAVFLYKDGVRRALNECACNISISEDSGALAKFEITGLGKKYDTYWGDAVIPAVTYNGKLPVVFMGSQMNMDIGGVDYAPINSSASFNFGATVSMRSDSKDTTGWLSAHISSRADAGGTLTIEQDSFATFDPDDLKNSSTIINLTYRIGDGTIGRTWYFNETINITDWSEGDVDGIATYELTYERVGETYSDDEGYMVAV